VIFWLIWTCFHSITGDHFVLPPEVLVRNAHRKSIITRDKQLRSRSVGIFFYNLWVMGFSNVYMRISPSFVYRPTCRAHKLNVFFQFRFSFICHRSDKAPRLDVQIGNLFGSVNRFWLKSVWSVNRVWRSEQLCAILAHFILCCYRTVLHEYIHSLL